MRILRRPFSAALLVLCCVAACSREAENEPLSGKVAAGGPIVIISIDTLRADRLPAWGYSRVETPAIDTLVRDGVRFSSAWSHVPLTLPAHASMFTGLLPGEHGVRDNLGYRLDAETPTLARLLQEKGYATAGMVSAWVLREESGIANGFQTWDDGLDPRPGAAVGELQRNGNATVDAATRWIAARAEDSPWLLFLHLFEPHTPYAPPEPFRSKYADPYEGEIAAADSIVDRLLTDLRSRGIYDDATIILLSDHGEGLGDHGEAEHGIFLYREALHVPLIVKLPGSHMGGTTIDAPVQLVDVFPTVLQAAGVETEVRHRGTSLVEIAAGRAPLERRVFSESMYPRIHLGWSELTSLTDGVTHVIQAPRPELYKIPEDPAEKNNLVSTERRLYAEFRKEIESLATPYAPPSPVDAEEAARLTALGYLGAGPSSTSGPLPDPKDRIGELQALNEASAASRSGRTSEAIDLYEGVLERNPQLADGWILLAQAYEEAGRPQDAIRASKRAIQIAPSLAQGVALNLARLQLMTHDLDGAEQHAALGARASPDEAKVIMGRIALARRDFDRAAAIASSLMNNTALRGVAAVLLAQAHIGKRDPQRALTLLEAERARYLAGSFPLPAQMEFARGDALVRLGRVDEGIAAFESEIRLHPRNVDAYTRLAAVYLLSGRVEEGEKVMRRLVNANPGRQSYFLAADTFERLQQPALAREWRARGERSAAR